MQCTNCGAELQLGATVCPVCEERVVPTRKSVATPRKRTSKRAAPAARVFPEPQTVPEAKPVVSAARVSP
jgi:uncharacterized Zn finger protein (UPF0148 family)